MYYIYELFNKVTGRKYIGMTTNHQRRFNGHMSMLKYGTHTERLLQKDYVLYGAESFDYRLLEFVPDKKTAHQREKHYMNLFKTYLDDFGYNSQDTIFNKYQNSNESVNSQNFFYKKIKETGLPLYKVAKELGISRKSLIHGITHPNSMTARSFLKLVNFIDLDKAETIEYMGWLTDPFSKFTENEKEMLLGFCKLSEKEQDLVLQMAERLSLKANH